MCRMQMAEQTAQTWLESHQNRLERYSRLRLTSWHAMQEAVYETAEQMAQTWLESHQNRQGRRSRGDNGFDDREGGGGGYGNRRRCTPVSADCPP